MRILEVSGQKELEKIMQDLKVDSYGIKIMAPKAISHLVRLNSVSCIAANILKQEMLSLGADVAIARDALTGRAKTTDCLMMGSLSQFHRLAQKLARQPLGLDRLAKVLSGGLADYQRSRFIIDLGKHKLSVGRRPLIMGILNLTPDSFSGDGLYKACSDNIIEFTEQMVKDGADIIDIGAESSRPGARPVSVKEELKRAIPLIKLLAKKIKLPLSIDTYKPEVARQALDNGVVMINDITGLRNPNMLKFVAKYKAGVIIMHMKGNPRTMQKNPVYESLIDEILEFFAQAIDRAVKAGIDRKKIILDPGIGFGKTAERNLEILKRLRELKVLGRPILVGPSRKSFIGKILNAGPQDRLCGTLASCVLAVKNGANLIRVHDVKEVTQALKITEAIINI